MEFEQREALAKALKDADLWNNYETIQKMYMPSKMSECQIPAYIRNEERERKIRYWKEVLDVYCRITGELDFNAFDLMNHLKHPDFHISPHPTCLRGVLEFLYEESIVLTTVSPDSDEVGWLSLLTRWPKAWLKEYIQEPDLEGFNRKENMEYIRVHGRAGLKSLISPRVELLTLPLDDDSHFYETLVSRKVLLELYTQEYAVGRLPAVIENEFTKVLGIMVTNKNIGIVDNNYIKQFHHSIPMEDRTVSLKDRQWAQVSGQIVKMNLENKKILTRICTERKIDSKNPMLRVWLNSYKSRKTKIANLEKVLNTVESATSNNQMLDAMKSASAMLSSVQSEERMDEAAELMDDIGEQISDANEMDDLLAANVGDDIEAELLEELEQLDRDMGVDSMPVEETPIEEKVGTPRKRAEPVMETKKKPKISELVV